LSDELQDGCLDIYSLRVTGNANVILGINNKSRSSFFIRPVYLLVFPIFAFSLKPGKGDISCHLLLVFVDFVGCIGPYKNKATYSNARSISRLRIKN